MSLDDRCGWTQEKGNRDTETESEKTEKHCGGKPWLKAWPVEEHERRGLKSYAHGSHSGGPVAPIV